MAVGMIGRVLTLAGIGVLMAGGALAEGRTVEIATLEWPPYVSAQMPEEGASSAVLKAAFRAAGYDVHLQFLPWKRAVDAAAQHEGGLQGFFPGYHCNQRPGLLASQPMGDGPLGFAERADKPLAWNSLDDLAGKTIGVVQGYANTADFDARVKDGRITVDQAPSDVSNLRKLSQGRLDAAVVDRYVLSYLLNTDSMLKGNADSIRFAARALEDKKLYLCASDDAAGRKLVSDFNAGLAKIDAAKLIEDYFSKL